MEPWRYLKLRYIINCQKGGTFLFMLWLMSFYHNYSVGCWLYLGLHGTYGFCWLIKDFAFPDKNFDFYTSPLALLGTFIILAVYWMLPFLQASGAGIQVPSPERLAACIVLFALGITLMIGSDAQKTFTLKHKKGLIADGLFKYTRNPNYLGEIMIYLSFAACTGLWESYILLVVVWLVLFATRMYAKDQSFAKKKGWAEYKNQSWVLLPKLVPTSDLATTIIYLAIGWVSIAWFNHST